MTCETSERGGAVQPSGASAVLFLHRTKKLCALDNGMRTTPLPVSLGALGSSQRNKIFEQNMPRHATPGAQFMLCQLN